MSTARATFIVVLLTSIVVVGAACQKKVTNENIKNVYQKIIALPANHMTISSSVFSSGQPIPAKYTCDGISASPPLVISGLPSKTLSLVLLLEDPDAPRAGGFLHWIMWNVPPTTTTVPENAPPTGAILGKNDSGTNTYVGPCPPSGQHRYYFRLFALDTKLDLPTGASQAETIQAINGHVLAQAELMGTYERSK